MNPDNRNDDTARGGPESVSMKTTKVPGETDGKAENKAARSRPGDDLFRLSITLLMHIVKQSRVNSRLHPRVFNH